MESGWRYRLVSLAGVGMLAVLAVAVANLSAVQAAFQLLPVVGHLPFEGTGGVEFAIEAGTTVVVLLAALFPLYKPRPRRILDVALLAGQRTTAALLTLAAIGYFDYDYRLPRATLIVAGAVLLVAVPVWFVAIRRRPGEDDRTILIGDDAPVMEDVLGEVDGSVAGYVSSPSGYAVESDRVAETAGITDGGERPQPQTIDDLPFLGGLSRLNDVLVNHDIDTAVLAFRYPDRGEFFGALDTCYEYGVNAKVHRSHANEVLIDSGQVGDLVDVNIEPWDLQDSLVKRLFDLVVSGGALLVLSPLILLIVLAIKVEGKGPVFFSQERTYLFGETFTIRKFRTLVPDEEGTVGTEIDDDRRTKLGEFLRTTHLDEIPQLWSIFTGKMSIVGPRPAQTELEPDFETEAVKWRKRWFVKPGLTGLAQIRGATSQEPREKLRHDLQYIRQQSLRFDLLIFLRQIWLVVIDTVSLFRNDEDAKRSSS